MAKPKTIYRCTECGYESAKWNGKCPSCGAWNTLEEDVPLPAQAVGNSRRKPVDLSDKIQELDEVDTTADVRYHTGVGELDRVLGGGLVRGSIVLLGGEPGIGKSTLLLQICQYFGESHSVLYVSGEESAKQIKLRAQRLGVTTRSLYLLTVTDAQSICDTISASRPVKKPATAATIAGRVPLFPTIRLAKPVSTAMPPRMAATSVDSQSNDATPTTASPSATSPSINAVASLGVRSCFSFFGFGCFSVFSFMRITSDTVHGAYASRSTASMAASAFSTRFMAASACSSVSVPS